jgi:hypothetical protein
MAAATAENVRKSRRLRLIFDMGDGRVGPEV